MTVETYLSSNARHNISHQRPQNPIMHIPPTPPHHPPHNQNNQHRHPSTHKPQQPRPDRLWIAFRSLDRYVREGEFSLETGEGVEVGEEEVEGEDEEPVGGVGAEDAGESEGVVERGAGGGGGELRHDGERGWVRGIWSPSLGDVGCLIDIDQVTYRVDHVDRCTLSGQPRPTWHHHRSRDLSTRITPEYGSNVAFRDMPMLL